MQNNINTPKERKKPMELLALLTYGAAVSVFMPLSCAAEEGLVASPVFMALPIVLVILGFLLCYMITRSVRPILAFGIIAFLVLAVLGVPSISAMIPLTFFGTALLAYVCFRHSPFWLIATSVPAFALALILTGDPIVSIAAFIPSAVGLTIYLLYKTGQMRVSSVIGISLVLGFCTVAIALGSYLTLGGELSISAIANELTELRKLIITLMTEATTLTYDQLQLDLISRADIESLVTLSVNTVFNYFPAIFVIFLSIVAYVAHSVFIALIFATGEPRTNVRIAVNYRVSTASGIIFIAAFLLSAILKYDGYELYGVMLENIYIILCPALTMLTFGIIGTLLKGDNSSCLGHIVYILMYIALFRRPDIVFPLASFVGSIIVITTEIKERIERKKDGSDK